MMLTLTRNTIATLGLLMVGLVLGLAPTAWAESRDSRRVAHERSYGEDLLTVAYAEALVLGDDEMADLIEMMILAPDWWLDGLEPKPSPGPRPSASPAPNQGRVRIAPLPSPKPRFGVGRIGIMPLPSPKPRFGVGRIGIMPLPSPKPRFGVGRIGIMPLPSPKPRARRNVAGSGLNPCRRRNRVSEVVGSGSSPIPLHDRRPVSETATPRPARDPSVRVGRLFWGWDQWPRWDSNPHTPYGIRDSKSRRNVRKPRG